MAKKNTKGIIIGVIAVCAAIGALSPDKAEESTEGSVPAYEAEYDIDTEVPVEDSTPDEDTVKAEEERLAKEAEEQRAAEEKAAKEKAAKEAEEKKQAEEKAAKEAEAQKQAEEKAAKEAEEQKAVEVAAVATQSEPAQPQETAVVEEPPAPEESIPTPVSEMVWLSATGEKYHSKNNCGRMNPSKARQVSLEDAISGGYGKCSKCW